MAFLALEEALVVETKGKVFEVLNKRVGTVEEFFLREQDIGEARGQSRVRQLLDLTIQRLQEEVSKEKEQNEITHDNENG